MKDWKKAFRKVLATVLSVTMGVSSGITGVAAGNGAVVGATNGVTIDSTNFPDEEFRQYVANFDTDEDGTLSQDEINAVSEMRIVGDDIQDLTGIDIFSNLESLFCSYTKLKTVKLDKLSNLTYLDFSSNKLTELDISNLKNLKELNCYNNELTDLNVSNLTNLSELNCSYNELTELDLSKLVNLSKLDCGSNKLTDLGLNNLMNLRYLYCGSNKFTKLDVSNLTNLSDLDCSCNELTELDLSKLINLSELYCSSNKFTKLDLSNLTNLSSLYCNYNELTELDLSNNQKLSSLYCSNNKITTLDISNNPYLERLDISDNIGITEIDLRNNPDLTDIDIYWMDLSGITIYGVSGSYAEQYADEIGAKFIAVTDISDAVVEIEDTTYIYDGNAKEPAVKSVTYNGSELVQGIDYVNLYYNNVDAGEATIVIAGRGNYGGIVKKIFTIDKAEREIKIDKTEIEVGETAKITFDGNGYIDVYGYNYSIVDVKASEHNDCLLVTGISEGVADINVYVREGEFDNYKEAEADFTITVKSNKTKLAAPTVSSITNKGSGVEIKWNKIPEAKGYYVYRAVEGNDASTTKITTINSNEIVNYVDDFVESGTNYTYWVCAYNDEEESDISDGVDSILYLASPVLTSLSNTSSGTTVNWNTVTGATGYILYRKTGNGSWSRVADIKSGTTTSYTDKTVKSGTTYTYTVRAYAGNTVGDWKSTKTIKYLATPTVSSAANITSGVQVKWTKVTGASGYYVYRKTGKGSWNRIANIKSGTTTSYTDKTAKSGTTYTYTVRAYSGSYISSYNAAGKTVKRLTTPTLGTVSNTASGITVKWTKVTGASGYYVYRKSGNGSWTRLATVKSGSTLNYNDTKAVNGTVYTYTVRAYSGSYASSYNATGKTIARLTRPSISSVTNQTGRKITVKWNRNTKATGYQIYYRTGSTVKIVTVSGNANVSNVISSLTKGKTYTVYVRSYKKSGSVAYYSAWSAAKSVKITK